jgi:uncharacterized protein (TIGR04255 family)
MKDSKPQLPDYENPPVIEVVCGAHFDPLPGFRSTTVATFWRSINSEYPDAQDQAPLSPPPSVSESVETPSVTASRLPPLPRVFLIGKQPNWLMQIQHDRFLHNWRKLDEKDTYPHYPEVSKRYWDAWAKFSQFCRDNEMGAPHVRQLEMTYVNHVLQHEGWESLSDMGTVFPDLTWRSEHTFLPSPDFMQWSAAFRLPEDRGRLDIAIKPARRQIDSAGLLLCELTVRGRPEAGDERAMSAWFDLARQWIVCGFADLASDKVQTDVWQRKV